MSSVKDLKAKFAGAPMMGTSPPPKKSPAASPSSGSKVSALGAGLKIPMGSPGSPPVRKPAAVAVASAAPTVTWAKPTARRHGDKKSSAATVLAVGDDEIAEEIAKEHAKSKGAPGTDGDSPGASKRPPAGAVGLPGMGMLPVKR